MAVGLAICGGLYNRVGPRVSAVIGAILVTVSMVGFTRLTVTTTGAELQPWLIVRGLGLGLFIQPLQTLAVSMVSRQQMARATSLRNSTTTVINAVGVAVFTSYLTQQATAQAPDHRAVPPDQVLEGGLVTGAKEALEQFGVRLSAVQDAQGLADEVDQTMCRHGCASPRMRSHHNRGVSLLGAYIFFAPGAMLTQSRVRGARRRFLSMMAVCLPRGRTYLIS